MSITHETKQIEKKTSIDIMNIAKIRHKQLKTSVVRLKNSEGEYSRSIKEAQKETEKDIISTSTSALLIKQNKGFIELCVKQGRLKVVDVIKKTKYFNRDEVLEVGKLQDSLTYASSLIKLLKVSRDAFNAIIKANNIEVVKIGGKNYVKNKDVEKIKTFF